MTTEPPRLNWTSIDPTEWLRIWQTVWRIAPDSLNQPILPGWTFNINSNNSSAPQTEPTWSRVTATAAELGRLSDAVAALIEAGHGKQPKAPAFADFLGMKSEIDAVKLRAAPGARRRSART